MSANIINHIVLVLDASSSMQRNTDALVKVADNQISYLATRSKELDQETRITVYTFADTAQCLIYDMDVLRVPSIANVYRAQGMTALIDGTMLALDDLAMTPEKYGEHSFLVYVLTDGMENRSRHHTTHDLSLRIDGLPDHWTVATFVPNQVAVHEAKRFGFPAQNIAVWDTTAAGVAEVGAKIRETTDTFMQARSSARAAGVTFRGTRNLFALKDVSFEQLAVNLAPLSRTKYRVYDVPAKSRIDDFVEAKTGLKYRRGTAYYELSKREIIQPQKQIAILGKTGGVYIGSAARQLLGLPDQHVRVSPNDNPDYGVFVQSTSDNRNLVPGTKLLLLDA